MTTVLMIQYHGKFIKEKNRENYQVGKFHTFTCVLYSKRLLVDVRNK
jgi:hypothetical protein